MTPGYHFLSEKQKDEVDAAIERNLMDHGEYRRMSKELEWELELEHPSSREIHRLVRDLNVIREKEYMMVMESLDFTGMQGEQGNG